MFNRMISVFSSLYRSKMLHIPERICGKLGRLSIGASAIFLILIAFASAQTAGDSLPKKIRSKKDGAEMVLVPRGHFTYGMNREEIRALLKGLRHGWADIYDKEFPRRQGELNDFYIDKYEVTNVKYMLFVRDTGHRPGRYSDSRQLSGLDQPVVGVGWSDAEKFCQWAGKRLPTEMEWEKTARGPQGWIWPWGDEADEYKYNGRRFGARSPIPVGSIPEGDSFYGVSDMAGNVWEMTSSPWPDEKSPTGRVMKGGSFLNPIGDVRASVRWAAADEEIGATWLGFRCVLNATDLHQYAEPLK